MPPYYSLSHMVLRKAIDRGYTPAQFEDLYDRIHDSVKSSMPLALDDAREYHTNLRIWMNLVAPHEEFSHHDPLYTAFSQVVREVEHLEARLSDKDQIVSTLRAANNSANTTMGKYIVERAEGLERRVGQLKDIAEEREERLKEETRLLDGRDIELEQRDVELEEKETEIEGLTEYLRDKNNKINALIDELSKKDETHKDKVEEMSHEIIDLRTKIAELGWKQHGTGSTDTSESQAASEDDEADSESATPPLPLYSPYFVGSPCRNCQKPGHWSPECDQKCSRCQSSSHENRGRCDTGFHRGQKHKYDDDDEDYQTAGAKRPKIDVSKMEMPGWY